MPDGKVPLITEVNGRHVATVWQPGGESVKVGWTHGICRDCFMARRDVTLQSTEPSLGKKGEKREQCCDCGNPTLDGIYIRDDPTQVRYPRVLRTEPAHR